MTRSRRVLIIIALVLAVVVVAGRFLRQDARYLHANHVSALDRAVALAA
jgi:hypothetical protein